MDKKSAIPVLILAPLFLSACTSISNFVSEYRIDVQQGNVVTQDMASQLKPGLTKDQVRFVLGSPLLLDPFHPDRWDYVYRLHKGKSNTVETRQFSVFFDSAGKLARVDGDVVADVASGTVIPADTSGTATTQAVSTPETKTETQDGLAATPEADTKNTPTPQPGADNKDSKVKVIDIGHIAEDGSYTPPPQEQPGLWSRMMNRLGF